MGRREKGERGRRTQTSAPPSCWEIPRRELPFPTGGGCGARCGPRRRERGRCVGSAGAAGSGWSRCRARHGEPWSAGCRRCRAPESVCIELLLLLLLVLLAWSRLLPDLGFFVWFGLGSAHRRDWRHGMQDDVVLPRVSWAIHSVDYWMLVLRISGSEKSRDGGVDSEEPQAGLFTPRWLSVVVWCLG